MRNARLHDALKAFTEEAANLLAHDAAAYEWQAAIERLPIRIASVIRCLSVGAAGADLVDPEARWRDLSETDSSGAVLIRPDGHIAWRVRTLPGDPAVKLEEVVSKVLSLH